MSDSSSSSSSAPKLDDLLTNQPAPAIPAPAEAAHVPTPTTSTSADIPPTTAVTEPTTEIVVSSPLREDMIKSAVSFLTSPSVRSADKAKKTAFLQQKGLSQAEIDQAFRRVGDSDSGSSPTIPVQQQQQVAPPILPSRNYAAAQQPQIIYYPQPSNPPIPLEKLFAMAVILGMSTVGLTAGIIGLLKHFISPIFNRIATHKRTRYNQYKIMTDKLLKSLQSTENDDLDALIDQGEEKTVVDALAKHQIELSNKMEKLVKISKERLKTDSTMYSRFSSELSNFRSVVLMTNNTNDMYSSAYYNRGGGVGGGAVSPAVSALKGDIRSFKAVLLNRRNFPK